MAKVFTITEGLENMGALRTGGQGSVYKGKRMGAILSAVKLLPTPIHAENTEDKNFRDFQNEVEKLKKVNEDPSPNVVKILNSGLTESGSLPFIEMEYIEGPDLEDLLKPPHSPIFTIRETIKLADHLANALAHCHKVGVKHGDIKSNNIKFNTDTGNYILLDFGLAVMSDEQRRSSLRHAGAVEFMAPEQHDGKMLFQSDIYSYGIILYELLAGTVPFPLINKTETSRNMVMLSHIEKQIPDVMELRKNRLPVEWSEEKKAHEMMAPAWLLQIIEKCLEKDPEKRFHDGVGLYEAVSNSNQDILNNEQVTTIINELKAENERLTNLVQKYEKGGKAKAFLIGGIILFICLATFGINLVLNQRKGTETDSTNVVSKPIQPVKSSSKTEPGKKVTTVNPDTLQTVPAAKKDTIKPKTTKKTKDGLINDVPEF
ncbi:serine/threonine protein kinase [Pedobacter panaciterrae]|jgi:Serine/threonine protein kinase|uniref:serine/threonine protein kinase n=1 Tax=Pedobacter panaciterrae TaxID=363849 RepID=UPI00155DDA8B|nr:serine/threonine-protein kinase [Pedobacter panaciterrae]NQX54244.1 serine/threonine protein kinase [Pedobacter panaciterrae]